MKLKKLLNEIARQPVAFYNYDEEFYPLVSVVISFYTDIDDRNVDILISQKQAKDLLALFDSTGVKKNINKNGMKLKNVDDYIQMDYDSDFKRDVVNIPKNMVNSLKTSVEKLLNTKPRKWA